MVRTIGSIYFTVLFRAIGKISWPLNSSSKADPKMPEAPSSIVYEV